MAAETISLRSFSYFLKYIGFYDNVKNLETSLVFQGFFPFQYFAERGKKLAFIVIHNVKISTRVFEIWGRERERGGGDSFSSCDFFLFLFFYSFRKPSLWQWETKNRRSQKNEKLFLWNPPQAFISLSAHET